MAYSKGSFADQLGISREELEKRARNSGFNTTEDYYNSTGGTGKTQEDVLNKISNNTNQFVDEYSGAIDTIWDRVSKEQNVQGLQNIAQNAVNTLEDIPSNVATTAKQFGMSAPRIQQRITGQTSKFAPTAQRAISNAQTAITTANDLFSKELAPYEWKAGQIAAQNAMEFTGYNNQIANNLTLTLQKIASGQAVDQAELENANAMALLEKKYELALMEYLGEKKIDKQYGSDLGKVTYSI